MVIKGEIMFDMNAKLRNFGYMNSEKKNNTTDSQSKVEKKDDIYIYNQTSKF